MRRVCYVSGTRADFGLMERALKLAARDPRLELGVCVTGMHLSERHGRTVRDIEAAGLAIAARIPLAALEGSSGADMGRAVGQALVGLADAMAALRPDVVVVLGDRGEMLAGAAAALHLNIPIVHVHGGERSGTVDEPLRHAISKLAHLHFVATPGARERLVRMGERAEHIFVTGAPGLDGLAAAAKVPRAQLCAEQKFDTQRPVALAVFHPVVQEADDAGRQMQELMTALHTQRMQALCFTPNSDAGSERIRAELDRHAGECDVRVLTHLERERYLSWMAAADVMVGNSSSGIIEAASLALPVVNVGSRQTGRERSGNVIDVPEVRAGAIAAAIGQALKKGKGAYVNVYGDGRASERIVELLATVSLGPTLLHKTNAY